MFNRANANFLTVDIIWSHSNHSLSWQSLP